MIAVESRGSAVTVIAKEMPVGVPISKVAINRQWARLPGLQPRNAMMRRCDTVVHASNNAGGLEGGMTNSEPLVMPVAMKPTPTLTRPLPSVDLAGSQSVLAHTEYSDVYAVPATGIVVEAMTAFVLSSNIRASFSGDTRVKLSVLYKRRMDDVGSLLTQQGEDR